MNDLISTILSGFNNFQNTITFIDIDDTIFKTDTYVYVIDKDGNIVTKLNSYDYNYYKLKEGEKFDYREFRSSDVFSRTAEVNPPVLRKIERLLQIIRYKKGIDKIIFLTARADMDNKDLFLEVFKAEGIPVNEKNIIYIERAGNINKPTPLAKKEIIDKYISKGNYEVVKMLDDSKDNLISFLELKKEYPEIEFKAFLVNKEGYLKKFKGE